MTEPNYRDKTYQRFLDYITCTCGKRMSQKVERRPFTDPAYPRETFAVYEVLFCSCGGTKERRTAIGH